MAESQKRLKLTPDSTRRHRQASDARWRANMYVCFSLLKHSVTKSKTQTDEDDPQPSKHRKKLTRIGTLKQADIQLSALESCLSRLLEEKNETFGTSESLESVRNDFRELSALITEQVNNTRIQKDLSAEKESGARKKKKSNDSSNSNDLGIKCSGESIISDSSSNSTGSQSWNSSPEYSTMRDAPMELTDCLSIRDWRHVSDDVCSLWSSAGHLVSEDAGVSSTKYLDEYVDLDQLLSTYRSKSPTEFITPKKRALSICEVSPVKASKKLFSDEMDSNMTDDQETSLYDDFAPRSSVKVPDSYAEFSDDGDSVLPPTDLEIYVPGETPQKSSHLSSQSDPMVSAYYDGANESSCREMTVPRENRDSKTLVSPWKQEDITMECYELIG